MTTLSLHHPGVVPFLTSRPGFRLRGLKGAIARLWRRHKAKSAPTRCDDDMLKDLGISRAQANFETERPFRF